MYKTSFFLGSITFFLIGWIWLFSGISQDTAATLSVGIITVLGAIWTASYTKLKDTELQIQAKLSQRREEVTRSFMEGFWNIAQDEFKNEATKNDYIRKVLKDFMVNGSLWSSDDTLKNFVNFRLESQKNTDPRVMVRHLAKLILSFRNDLGHKNLNLSEKDVLDVFLNDTDTIFKK